MDDSECVKWDLSQFPWISSMPPVRVVSQHTYNIHCTICKRRGHIKRAIFKDLSFPPVPPTTLLPPVPMLPSQRRGVGDSPGEMNHPREGRGRPGEI